MRVLAWNFLHGGGKRIPSLAAAVLSHAPDVCVMAESRTNGQRVFADLMAAEGYTHVATSDTVSGKNGVLVASRTPFTQLRVPQAPIYQQRWLRVKLNEYAITLLACHVPPKISIGAEAKRAFWQTLLAHAADHINGDQMIIGDLNTGAPYRDEHRATLYSADQFQQLEALGWIDAWRCFHGPAKKEWSWVYPRRRSYGYRLDHAFVTPSLSRQLMACRYSHHEREAGISDHSILLVDLDRPARNRA
ncbi:MAG: endonuclease/exonuclease/phosphatase family protein [Gaiellales bacterium]